MPATQVNAANDCNTAASAKSYVAKTLPHDVSIASLLYGSNRAKATERRFGRDVFDTTAAFGSLAFSHDANLLVGLRVVRAGAGDTLRSARFILHESVAA